jgi:hypothetical protein
MGSLNPNPISVTQNVDSYCAVFSAYLMQSRYILLAKHWKYIDMIGLKKVEAFRGI